MSMQPHPWPEVPASTARVAKRAFRKGALAMRARDELGAWYRDEAFHATYGTRAPAVHADETPARATGGMRYVHLACTAYLTHMHTGDRSADAIDAGGVLPGYRGVIVRDGYSAYGHLTDALHTWCGAQYAEPGIMRNGAAGVARVACRGGDRADAGAERFCIIAAG